MNAPVVADTVTLREFAESGRLDILQKAFTGPVHVTAAVRAELVRSRPFAPRVTEVLGATWITWWPDETDPTLVSEIARIRSGMSRTSDPQTKNLGEAQSIVLAREIGSALFCTDDYDAARLAKRRMIAVIGTPDVLREAVAMDHLSCDQAVALYREMQGRQPNWPVLTAADLCT